MKHIRIRYPVLIFLLAIGWQAVIGQPAEAPSHLEDVNKDLGYHNGMSIAQLSASGARIAPEIYTPAQTIAFPPSSYTVIQENISAADHAPWVRLVFGNVNLGENSYIVITSDEDQDQQFFNANTIAEWSFYSAYFKGKSVMLELFVAPGDENITVQVPQLIVGDFVGGQPIPLSLCGADDRLSSTYPYVDGRLMSFGCTGWTTAAGFYLTAGHCEVLFSSSTIMEFNVPSSLPDGTTQPAAVNDQYPVISSTSTGQNAGIGDDWGIYNCGANSNTGLTPAEAERAYYHLSRSLAPPSMFVRGFGTDETPPGTTGFRNADSQTLQYQSGPSLGENITSATDIDWEYVVDTEGGNSGSAILSSGVTGVNFHSVGIHTHAGCAPPSAGNHGTSFEADDTEAAMDIFWQSQVEYVDIDHHLSSTTGTSLFPHYSIQNALNQANAGHGPGVSALELILIAGSNQGSGGVYAQSVSYSGATNGVVLRRTVGAVKIGPGATAKAPVSGVVANGD
jgi:hypothetical protein